MIRQKGKKRIKIRLPGGVAERGAFPKRERTAQSKSRKLHLIYLYIILSQVFNVLIKMIKEGV